MRLIPFIIVLSIITCCGSTSKEGEREQNIIRVKFTDIDGNIFDSNEKSGEYLKVKTSGGLLVLERVQADGSPSRFQFKGDIISQNKQDNQQVYWAKSHHSESTDKFILFGIDRKNNTIDSLYQDYGEDYHVPQARLLKFFGDLRWVEK